MTALNQSRLPSPDNVDDDPVAIDHETEMTGPMPPESKAMVVGVAIAGAIVIAIIGAIFGVAMIKKKRAPKQVIRQLDRADERSRRRQFKDVMMIMQAIDKLFSK